VDAQAEDFLPVRHQGRGQLPAVKVFRNQWVVGRLPRYQLAGSWHFSGLAA
jgi:hypothetical protein